MLPGRVAVTVAGVDDAVTKYSSSVESVNLWGLTFLSLNFSDAFCCAFIEPLFEEDVVQICIGFSCITSFLTVGRGMSK